MTSPPIVIGRAAELGELDRLIRELPRGGGVLTLEGEAGIGKTALVLAAARLAGRAGYRVLSCGAVGVEAAVGFDGLRRLLEPVLGRAEALPERQRVALLTALGRCEGPAPDLLLLGLATLRLLEEVAAERPLLLVVEDIRQIDPSSLDVVGFVSRRLTNTPILLLATQRPAAGADAPPLAGPVLRIARLSEAAAGEVADQLGVTPDTRRMLLDRAAGNPLALRELATAVHQHGLTSVTGVPEHLPMTDLLERTFVGQISEFPESTRRMLLVLAAAEDLPLIDVLAAARRFAVEPEDLDVAETAGLIRISGDRAVFRHPLVASAVYRAGDAAERDAVHRALSETTVDADRAAWHRALATHAEDESVAAALASAGQRARRRGALADAGRALCRAAALTASGEVRAARLVEASEAFRGAGRWYDAVRAGQEAIPLTTDPALLVPLAQTYAMMSDLGVPGDVDQAVFDEILGRLPSDQGRVGVLSAAAMAAVSRFEPRASIREALEPVGRSIDDPLLIAVLTVLDPVRYATRFRQQFSGAIRSTDDPVHLMVLGRAAEAVHDVPGSVQALDRAVDGFRRAGSPRDVCLALARRGRVRLAAGLLTAADGDLRASLRVAEDLELTTIVASAVVALARLRLRRGDSTAATDALSREAELVGVHPRRPLAADFAWTRGLLALAEGRAGDAWERFRAVSVDRETSRWALADLVEAGIASGRGDEVQDFVEDAAREAAVFRSPHLTSSVHRSQALLGSGVATDALYQEAIRIGREGVGGLELARTHLLYGAWLRQQRRVVEAREPLTDALQEFDRLRVAPLAERAAAELRAAGVSPARDGRAATVDAAAVLTPQELQIARLAAAGLTNREIADQVFLSHRTVGAHLYRIYPKLGISTRNELAGLLGRSGVA
ncbi:ATP-binding protein [Cryptosporangium arvum]|uniref:Transcriptional regulator, luxR family n=1 Tax=Cryptosporangium arvum DSM 44712 TaxID=927661 RepID=A0A010Z3Y6_9ACTN|nr:LuxR family transcriptional regulator [Cryptosporangium arvum]EXG82103.1 transcriptional regulator, luxR family [Cryptosporangium arvum DSM 44712]